MTDFRNDQGTGSVIADSVTAAAIGGGSLGVTGFFSPTAQLIAAAGASQGTATLMTKSWVVLTVCTASARGIKLPTAATNLRVEVFSKTTQGVKVYPNTNDRIKTSATNVAVVQAGFKGEIYFAVDAVTWVTLVGA